MAAAEPRDLAPRASPPGGSGRLSELLPLIDRRLPPALAGPAARRALAAVAGLLPRDGLTALELRLGGARTAPVDLAVRLDARTGRRLPPAARPRHLAGFLRSWFESGWPGVRWLWLEYDLDGPLDGPVDGARRASPPSLAAALAPGVPDPSSSGLLTALAGRTPSAAQCRRIRQCLAALPPGARLLYVFSMLSRPGRPARLEIGGLSFVALVRYLERVAGAEAAQRAVRLRALTAGAGPHHLALDVTDEVAPRFGIDCSFRRLPYHDPRWGELLDGVVGAGLCRHEEKDALLAWTGYDTFRSAFADWPSSAGLGGAVARGLSHVKLVSEPGRPPQAKAYLMLQFVPPRRVARPDRRSRERREPPEPIAPGAPLAP